MSKIEYLHINLQKIYSIDVEYSTDSEEFYCFQQSDNPEKLGYKYERDFTEAATTEPETV
jgi:hypothetical protein